MRKEKNEGEACCYVFWEEDMKEKVYANICHEDTFQSIISHTNTHGVTPHEHKNSGKKPSHSLEYKGKVCCAIYFQLRR